ncbi:MAG: cytochrome c-type biogenesis protein CcmH [Planctomycetes bacterium]|nr:cytochrome c-type biogenesis protein CcmH [Planctomycetota bacterium]
MNHESTQIDTNSSFVKIRVHSWLILLLLLCVMAPCAGAAPKQVRPPAEVERLYNQLGATMTCTCGCREVLLDCSHNSCPTKPEELRFLRGLCEDASMDIAAIRAGMAARFGDKILQAPSSSLLYPLLFVGGLLVIGVFSALVWAVRKGRAAPAALETTAVKADDPSLDARIEREIKEID